MAEALHPCAWKPDLLMKSSAKLTFSVRFAVCVGLEWYLKLCLDSTSSSTHRFTPSLKSSSREDTTRDFTESSWFTHRVSTCTKMKEKWSWPLWISFSFFFFSFLSSSRTFLESGRSASCSVPDSRNREGVLFRWWRAILKKKLEVKKIKINRIKERKKRRRRKEEGKSEIGVKSGMRGVVGWSYRRRRGNAGEIW